MPAVPRSLTLLCSPAMSDSGGASSTPFLVDKNGKPVPHHRPEAGGQSSEGRVYRAVFGTATQMNAEITRQGCRSADGRPLTVTVECCEELHWPFIYHPSGANTSGALEAMIKYDKQVLANQATMRKIKAHMREAHGNDPGFNVQAPKARPARRGAAGRAGPSKTSSPTVTVAPSSGNKDESTSPKATQAPGPAPSKTSPASPMTEGPGWPGIANKDGLSHTPELDREALLNSAPACQELRKKYRATLNEMVIGWAYDTMRQGRPTAETNGEWRVTPLYTDAAEYSDWELACQLLAPIKHTFSILISRVDAKTREACDAHFAAVRDECLLRCARACADAAAVSPPAESGPSAAAPLVATSSETKQNAAKLDDDKMHDVN